MAATLNFKTSEVFIALASKNVKKQVAFYSGLLQTKPTVNTSGYAELSISNLKIAIFQPSADNASEFAAVSSGAMSFCLEVSNIDGIVGYLTDLGYSVPGEIMQTSHGKEIYAYDPDGNRVILHQSPSH